MWNIHSLLNQKQSGESILGYDEICWMNGSIQSLKNAFKVKLKYQEKIAAELFYCTYNAVSGAHAAQRLWFHSL